jgi:hypothetical protein
LELLDADFERYQNQAKKRHEVLIDTVEREELLKRAQVEQRLRQAEELLASQNLLTQFNELANDKS